MGIDTQIASLPDWPLVDFSEFGDVELHKLSSVQKLTGRLLGRNWVAIPHVTHHDEIDVTEAENRRSEWNADHPGTKVTPVALLVRALAMVLKDFPNFNASLAGDGQSIVLKNYINIGVAVDTPGGLLVPVLKGADQMALSEIAENIALIAEKARNKGLSLAEMAGSSMSLTSLGHIGGTGFTPIINAPDVAILGATAIQDRPCKAQDGSLVWRKKLPLSLSYDHRVINGVDAARFLRAIDSAFSNDTMFT